MKTSRIILSLAVVSFAASFLLRSGPPRPPALHDAAVAKVAVENVARPLPARSLADETPAGSTATEAFNEWAKRYVASPAAERRSLLDHGIALASARRSELRAMIQIDPRRALESAVPPVMRQELPRAVAERLEERVNEEAFFGVMGALPMEGVVTPAYRREVLTKDGGRYRAFVYGAKLGQQTTERASIVGIAVDDVIAVDERPLRIVEPGEIPNHPNNLTRRRTVIAKDADGFVSDPVLREGVGNARAVVEVCPVSGITSAAPRNAAGEFDAVPPQQAVVEAGGKYVFLCTGGHIHALEEQLAAEGGNGGPVKPTSPPTATQSTGYKTNLLMRIAFPETRKESVSEKDGYDLGKNVQDWFVDTSYGAMTFMTTVTPILIMPRTEAWYKDVDTGSAGEVLTDARVVAKAAGFDPANFDFDTVIYTGLPGGFGGQAYVGGKGCWLKSGTGTGVACHEYGHNFGLWHANFWSTTNGSAIGGGAHVEYGDSFDTMGSASAGDLQYNACHKNLLNWLPTSYVHSIGASGTYRIYQMDQPRLDPRLRYAIKVRKDSARNYWVDLRQKFTSNAWVQGGVFLHWSPWATSAGGAHLLDTTPGSLDGKNDAPIVIGRTFSDFESDIYITPVAKNATSPPSVDVTVNVGPFPNNHAPTMTLAASGGSAAVNAVVTFTATATDPDGDVLAYAWDFGDKSFSTANAAVVTKSWATAGEYRVRCVASDMKGRTASSSVIVTVGAPGTFRISGTVTDGALPLADVRITSGTRETYTDTNGGYTLTGFASGSNTVNAQLYDYTMTPTGSATVTVGPSATVNFTGAVQSVVSLTVQDADCAEGANTGSFRISRTGDTSAALVVNFLAPTGTATSGTDYTALGTSATIPAGAAFVDLVVTATDDTAVESFETVIVELQPSTTYVLGMATATIYIADSDTTKPLVRMRVTDRDADESGDPAQFVIERIGPTTAALNVIIAMSGTATNGTDYTSVPTTITIPAGASSVPVNITPIQDSAIEGMETVILTISTDTNYVRAAASADYSGTVNLHDDDEPILTVVATDAAAAEAGSDPGIFTVTRTGSTAAALTVNYGMTGSALHGTDYVALPGVLTIPAGSSVGTIVITPIDDGIGEPAQTARLYIRSGLGYAIGSPGDATVTITDNNDVPYVAVSTTASAKESGTAGTFKITTTGTGTGNINVRYTMSGTATNGVDYTMLSGTLSIGKNTTANVTVTPLQDTLNEGYETVTLTLTPDPAYTIAVDSEATMNIEDDELPQINVSTTNAAFTETAGSLARFFVSRTGATTAALTVNYTMSGTATTGLDYTAPSGTVTIAAAATGAYVDVSMLADTLSEGTETMILNITPDAAYSLGFGSATRYIIDAQTTLPTVAFSPTTSSVAESVGTVNLNVTLSAAQASDVTVEWYTNGGTALGGNIDYVTTSGVLTFLAGETAKTIPLTIIDDSLDEANETVTLTLRNAFGAKLGSASHTVTILDNDTPPAATVGFAGATGSSSESVSPAQIAVALSSAQTSAVTVDYAVTGGTAVSGSDYTITAGTLTFAVGETVKIIPNTIINDAVLEPNKTIILTLTNAVGVALSPNTTHTYTIIDDDAVTVTIAATDAAAAEPADNGSFTLTRAGITTGALTVNLAIAGTATNGTDYATIPSTVVFASGVTTLVVPVTVIDDALGEGSETVQVTIASGAYTVGTPSVATVTIADDDINSPPVITLLSPTVTNVAIPNIATGLLLEATVTDDGKPLVPGMLTSAWTKVSGPGTVTFDNAAAATTGARFSIAGVYVLRLTANDGALQTTADLRVAVAPSVPASLQFANVGTGSSGGNYQQSGGTFTLTGNGASISSNAVDGFFFVWQSMPGTSWEIIARLASITGGSATSSRAGIMARTATGSADVEAFIGATSDSRLSFITRTTAGAVAVATNTASLGAPRWVRLVRNGANFSAYYSTDGVSWTQHGPTTAIANAANPMLVGLATTNAAGSTNAVGVFSDVSIALTDNIGPSVDAGVNVSGGLGQPRDLNATIGDDAKPVVPGAVTPLWTKLSGPGVATFGSAGATDTTVAFDSPGSYVLRLIANDGQVKTFDDVSGTATISTLSVAAAPGGNASESGPVVGHFIVSRDSAFGDLTVNVAMSGTATAGSDYTMPASVFIPDGQASISVPITPIADGLAEGTETVILTLASDSHYAIGAPASASITITDSPADNWRLAKFGADANNPAISGDLVDRDGDGLTNLLEYAFNTDPLSSSVAPALSLDGPDFVIIYRRNDAANDVGFTIRGTTDFTTWTDANATEQVQSDDGITSVIRAQIPNPGGPQHFYRIEVTHLLP